MGANVTEQGNSRNEQAATNTPGGIGGALANLRTGLGSLDWPLIVIVGVVAGILMPVVLTGGDFLQFLAGIVPVGAGLIIGRRVKSFYTLNGFVAGLIAMVVALVTLYVLIFYTPIGAAMQARSLAAGQPPALATPVAQFGQLAGFVAFALLIFSTFGASMSGRTEARNRAARAEVESRGGQLERAPAVREVDDIRGMSLPQFGSYVNNLFKKQGFTFKDYRFIDKDKNLDLWMEREGEPWHLRLSVVDKVTPGAIEGLYQEMKREGTTKGLVITSTEFTPGAAKSAKGRPIVLVDGPTLYEMAEK